MCWNDPGYLGSVQVGVGFQSSGNVDEVGQFHVRAEFELAWGVDRPRNLDDIFLELVRLGIDGHHVERLEPDVFLLILLEEQPIQAEGHVFRMVIGGNHPFNGSVRKQCIGQQGLGIRNQVLYSHTPLPFIFPGSPHIALQDHPIGHHRIDGENLDDIPVLQIDVVFPFYLVQIQIENDLVLLLGYSFHLDPLQIGRSGSPSGHFDPLGESRFSLQFVYGRVCDISGNSDDGTDGRDEDHVFGHEAGIIGFVPSNEKIVHIQLGDGLSLSLQLDIPQGSRFGRTSGHHEGIDDGRQGGYRDGPRGSSISHEVYTDGAQRSEADVHLKVGVVLGELFLKDLFQLLEGETRHPQDPHLGKSDVPIPIDDHIPGPFHAPPDSHPHLVPRSDHIVRTDRNIEDRLRDGILSISRSIHHHTG